MNCVCDDSLHAGVGFGQACAAVSIPVVAIDGIGKGNISRLAGTGVDGVAVVSAIFAAEDIESECRLLRRLSEEMVNP